MAKNNGRLLWERMSDTAREKFMEHGVQVKYLRASGRYQFMMWRPSIGDSKAYGKSTPILKGTLARILSEPVWYEDSDGNKTEIRVTDKNEYEDVDDDTYNDISLVVFKYWLSKTVIERVKTEAHKYALGRVLSPWVALEPIKPRKRLKKVDYALPENVANRDSILRKSAERGDIETYIAECADVGIGKKKAIRMFYKQRRKQALDNRNGTGI